MLGWLLLYGCGIGFINNISARVLLQDRFICSMWCCVPLPISEYSITGMVKCHSQLIVSKVLLSRYAVLNAYARSCYMVARLSFLFWNVDQSEVSEHMQMRQWWLSSGTMPGLVRSLTAHRACQSAALETDCHRDCKNPVHLPKSDIVQYALYVPHDPAVHPFSNSIRLR